MNEHSDLSVLEDAKDWINRVNGDGAVPSQWRLQIISNRKRPDGKKSPLRIRRFVEGIPHAGVTKAALEYLVSLSPYTGIIFNGETLEGQYRPTRTWWERDDRAVVNGMQRTDATYTLFQDLIPVDEKDSEDAVTEVSCTSEESTEWFWEDSSPGELPSPQQGVVWRLEVSYDRESGTFDWRRVKVVAKTQHTPETIVTCSSQVTATTEAWRNLYGPDDYGFYLDDTGAQVWKPPKCPSTDGGKSVTVRVTENPDCTFNAEIQTQQSHADRYNWQDGSPCSPTLHYVHDHVPWTGSASSYLAMYAPVKGPGYTVSSSAQHNDDMSWTFQWNVTETVEGAKEEWDSGSACRKQHIVVYHALRSWQKVKSLLPKLDGKNAKPGDPTYDVSVSRNERDCTYDLRIATINPNHDFIDSWTEGSTCRPVQVFKFQNSAEKPRLPDEYKLPEGAIVDQSIRLNDDCTWDGEIRVATPQATAYIEYEEGSPCRPRRIKTYMNSPEIPEIPPLEEGKELSVRVGRNSDCTWDATIAETRTSNVASAAIVHGSQCRAVTTVVKHGVLTSQLRSAVPSPGLGETVNADVRWDPSDCTWTVQYSVYAAPAGETLEWDSGALHVTTKHIHATGLRSLAEAQNLLSQYYPPEVGHNIDASITRDERECTYDVSIRDTVRDNETLTYTEGSCMAPHAVTYETASDSPAVEDTPGEGKSVSVSVTPNGDGTYHKVVKVVEPKEFYIKKQWVTRRGIVVFERYRNKKEPILPGDSLPAALRTLMFDVKTSFDINENCLYDGYNEWTTPSESGGSGQGSKTWGPRWGGDTVVVVRDPRRRDRYGMVDPAPANVLLSSQINGCLAPEAISEWLSGSNTVVFTDYKPIGNYGGHIVFTATGVWEATIKDGAVDQDTYLATRPQIG